MHKYLLILALFSSAALGQGISTTIQYPKGADGSTYGKPAFNYSFTRRDKCKDFFAELDPRWKDLVEKYEYCETLRVHYAIGTKIEADYKECLGIALPYIEIYLDLPLKCVEVDFRNSLIKVSKDSERLEDFLGQNRWENLEKSLMKHGSELQPDWVHLYDQYEKTTFAEELKSCQKFFYRPKGAKEERETKAPLYLKLYQDYAPCDNSKILNTINGGSKFYERCILKFKDYATETGIFLTECSESSFRTMVYSDKRKTYHDYWKCMNRATQVIPAETAIIKCQDTIFQTNLEKELVELTSDASDECVKAKLQQGKQSKDALKECIIESCEKSFQENFSETLVELAKTQNACENQYVREVVKKSHKNFCSYKVCVEEYFIQKPDDSILTILCYRNDVRNKIISQAMSNGRDARKSVDLCSKTKCLSAFEENIGSELLPLVAEQNACDNKRVQEFVFKDHREHDVYKRCLGNIQKYNPSEPNFIIRCTQVGVYSQFSASFDQCMSEISLIFKEAEAFSLCTNYKVKGYFSGLNAGEYLQCLKYFAEEKQFNAEKANSNCESYSYRECISKMYPYRKDYEGDVASKCHDYSFREKIRGNYSSCVENLRDVIPISKALDMCLEDDLKKVVSTNDFGLCLKQQVEEYNRSPEEAIELCKDPDIRRYLSDQKFKNCVDTLKTLGIKHSAATTMCKNEDMQSNAKDTHFVACLQNFNELGIMELGLYLCRDSDARILSNDPEKIVCLQKGMKAVYGNFFSHETSSNLTYSYSSHQGSSKSSQNNHKTAMERIVSDCKKDPPQVIGNENIKVLQDINIHTSEKFLPGSNIVIGGVSGVAYNALNKQLYLLSDYRVKKNTEGSSTIYQFTLANENGEFKLFPQKRIGIKPNQTGPQELQYKSMDPESLILMNSGDFIFSSEFFDEKKKALVNIISPEGDYKKTIAPPESFFDKNGSRLKTNEGIESISLSESENYLYMINEKRLDGEKTGIINQDNVVRIAAYKKTDTGDFAQEGEFAYYYEDEPDNGVSDVLAINDRTLLVLERSYSRSKNKITARLYKVKISKDSSNILGLPAIGKASKDIVPLKKELFVDFDNLLLELAPGFRRFDNLEAISFGPTLENQNRTLIMATDNNFSQEQRTQVLILEVKNFGELQKSHEIQSRWNSADILEEDVTPLPGYGPLPGGTNTPSDKIFGILSPHNGHDVSKALHLKIACESAAGPVTISGDIDATITRNCSTTATSKFTLLVTVTLKDMDGDGPRKVKVTQGKKSEEYTYFLDTTPPEIKITNAKRLNPNQVRLTITCEAKKNFNLTVAITNYFRICPDEGSGYIIVSSRSSLNEQVKLSQSDFVGNRTEHQWRMNELINKFANNKVR